jgi:hypothetical protein
MIGQLNVNCFRTLLFLFIFKNGDSIFKKYINVFNFNEFISILYKLDLIQNGNLFNNASKQINRLWVLMLMNRPTLFFFFFFHL